MVKETKERLPHILVAKTVSTERYSSVREGRNNPLNIPPRDRAQHSEKLIQQIEATRQQELEIIQEQKAFGLNICNGIYLTFESEPSFDIKYQSLEFQRSGIELCSLKEINNRSEAVVFVPEGKLEFFLRKIIQYRDEVTIPKSEDKLSQPKNRELIESISDIKLAALQQLWTDDKNLFPSGDENIWWEVWLRCSNKIDYEAFLREHAEQLNMTVGKESISFLDRTVLLVQGNKEQMSRSIQLLGSIAEVRRAKETAAFFVGLDPKEQAEWIKDALQRIQTPTENPPRVCLLDTGVNESHPLLRPIAASTDMHSYDKPNWGTDDRYGHGTQMAGLIAYGDLTSQFTQAGVIELTHRLESVKIIPEPGSENNPKLYGAIIRESISRVEIEAEHQRVYCMAVTAKDYRDRGRPSSWSATVDALTSGAKDEQYRLIILSAGNTDISERHRYPDSSFTDEIHDPGQAWNALSVGGCTEKVWFDTNEHPGWEPIACAGDLSPSSCTSMTWDNKWPIKPDIVMEAGNTAKRPEDNLTDYLDDALQLLSTGHRFTIGKQLVSFGDTSAAAALASRLAAMVMAQYPNFWPETVRALIVHSAQWTKAMKSRFVPEHRADQRQQHYQRLLRYCGYGLPNVEDLFWSTKNILTLIAQESLQPFLQDDGKIKTCDINLHTIPWPTEVLQELGSAEVELKVTLSYFIEPNPGERGWANKYRYASHGLRFDVRRPLETLKGFKERINKKARDEDFKSTQNVRESGHWTLGENLRKSGSLHSDTWHGTAAELAERRYVAVYPVLGWWKERPNLQCWGKQARYALIMTIKTPEVINEVITDIYSPITEILTKIETEI